MQSIWYAADPGLWKTVLSPPGPLKAWLLANKKAPLAPYITPDVRITVYNDVQLY